MDATAPSRVTPLALFPTEDLIVHRSPTGREVLHSFACATPLMKPGLCWAIHRDHGDYDPDCLYFDLGPREFYLYGVRDAVNAASLVCATLRSDIVYDGELARWRVRLTLDNWFKVLSLMRSLAMFWRPDVTAWLMEQADALNEVAVQGESARLSSRHKNAA